MKKLIATLVALYATVAQAATVTIGVQWNVPPGATMQWSGASGGGCGAPNQGGYNCVQIPYGTVLRECKGTQTSKTNGEEILMRLVSGNGSGFTTLWQGENFGTSTVVVQTPVQSPTDPYLQGGNYVWIEFQADAPAPAGLEMQVTCSVY